MENIVLRVPHLKHICTESDKQKTSVLSVRIHDQMDNWIVDKHPSA